MNWLPLAHPQPGAFRFAGCPSTHWTAWSRLIFLWPNLNIYIAHWRCVCDWIGYNGEVVQCPPKQNSLFTGSLWVLTELELDLVWFVFACFWNLLSCILDLAFCQLNSPFFKKWLVFNACADLANPKMGPEKSTLPRLPLKRGGPWNDIQISQ